MIVVSDTSVISALIQVGHADLLPEIFGGVIIPERVAEELAVSRPFPVITEGPPYKFKLSTWKL